MDNLLSELESLKITGNMLNDNLWQSCIQLLENTLVPEKRIGMERPCEEKDYREYRQIVNRNLRNIESTLRHMMLTLDDSNRGLIFQSQYLKTFLINLLLIIGEHSEQNVWNTAESVTIAHNLNATICDFCNCESLPKLLAGQQEGCSEIHSNNVLGMVLLALRPKLLKDIWKAYPAAVHCYKWLLWQVEEPNLVYHLSTVIPTALIILDDYIVENRLLGIRCIEKILQHSHMRKELVDTGYAEVIYDALKRILLLREATYVVPLYSCLRSLLSTSEYYNKTNCLQWTRRDDILLSLLGNMECEQNLDLRHAYMCSLPGVLTNIGCAKWCERLTRILSEYCEHHTDLKTLKVTMETTKIFLVTCQPRVPAHCVALYGALLKLHMDLVETPIFDTEIMQNLEDCIGLLYKLTPAIGNRIFCDDRMKSTLNQQLQFRIFENNTYFE